MKYPQGGCLCAAVRYEITAAPIALFCCHCTECQRTSGSSFVLALRVPYGGVRVTRGEAELFVRPEPDGQKRNVARCSACLSALWSKALSSPEHHTVYAGTLDDSSSLRPVAHIWTQDMQPWIALPEGTLQYPQNPPDMDAIAQAFRYQTRKRIF